MVTAICVQPVTEPISRVRPRRLANNLARGYSAPRASLAGSTRSRIKCPGERPPCLGAPRASLAGSTRSRIKCPGERPPCLGVSLYLAFCLLEHQFRRSRKSLEPVSLRATVVSWATHLTNSLEKRRTLFSGASPGGKDI